ncbi:MAG: trypsin-like peptidase domain-containing protein [Desulfosarcinaceae bacterium]|nr:trypsin-like peptidase domain-containing protein [Desulfosarcinaceae bacterium]
MKLCPSCGQGLAQSLTICPVCGQTVGNGLQYVDDYEILEIVHENRLSILCKARLIHRSGPVMLRLFTAASGVDEVVAARLTRELEELRKLPADRFVQHQQIKRSSEGLWYRVSEWVDAVSWGDLIAGGRLTQLATLLKLFEQMTTAIEELHRRKLFIPHLILDDIMVTVDPAQGLRLLVDYKLSRFLTPSMDSPRPMLRDLLRCHPDILSGAPLDYRSDIWSLGKVFIEILTADFITCDHRPKIEFLKVPEDLKRLLRTMQAEDPDLRPKASSVAEILRRMQREASHRRRRRRTPATEVVLKKLRLRISVLLAVVVFLLVALVPLWFFMGGQQRDDGDPLAQYANIYAGSVAFVLVGYELTLDDTVIYQNQTEGTAFLVDGEGYLLTNRHVACPWLEDSSFQTVIARLKAMDQTPRFSYRIYLWFEGERAFFRSPEVADSTDPADLYFLENAYASDRNQQVEIVGVAKPQYQTGTLIKAPLQDDFAVLKIDAPPHGLTPLPLSRGTAVTDIPRLSPVITLGFPLGRQTQVATVNVSVTRGHVRRAFENLLQVDSSIHRGNSGGPVIGETGRVLGIASGVAIDRSVGPLPVMTPQSDIGMVLPIEKVAAFLDEIKLGRLKWNGVIDPGVESRVETITAKALTDEWQTAVEMVETALEESSEPALYMLSGILNICLGDRATADRRLRQTLSMDPDNNQAAFFLYLLNDHVDHQPGSTFFQQLVELNWRSSDEFFGYLTRLRAERIDPVEAMASGWDTRAERAWITLVVGQLEREAGRLKAAEDLFTQAVRLADIDDWSFLLARGYLNQVQQQRLAALPSRAEQNAYRVRLAERKHELDAHREAVEKVDAELAALVQRLNREAGDIAAQRRTLEEMRALDGENGDLLAGLAFYSAMDEAWEPALTYSRDFLSRAGRESASRLSVGLLEAEILLWMGRTEEMEASLKSFHERTRDPWYRALSAYFLERTPFDSSEDDLYKQLGLAVGQTPENLVTAHTALGFWSESQAQTEVAKRHYKEALGSYLDNWLEYELARERLRRLRSEE